MPSSLRGWSPLDIDNAASALSVAPSSVGSPVDPGKLSGKAAEAYKALLGLGIDPSSITIYQSADGSFSAVLTPGAFAALQQSGLVASNPGDAFLHYPYTSGARDLSPTNSLHLVWFDPRLTDFLGGFGVLMQFHIDKDNPWQGSLMNHALCTFLKYGC